MNVANLPQDSLATKTDSIREMPKQGLDAPKSEPEAPPVEPRRDANLTRQSALRLTRYLVGMILHLDI